MQQVLRVLLLASRPDFRLVEGSLGRLDLQEAESVFECRPFAGASTSLQ